MMLFLVAIIALGVVLSVPALRYAALFILAVPALALLMTWLGD
jgi:hypothetical protein